MTQTERVSSITYLLFKLSEPRGTAPKDKRGIFFSLPVNAEILKALEHLLEAGKHFGGTSTENMTVGAHKNPETYRSIDGVRLLANPGDASETLEAYIRVKNGEGRMFLKLEQQTLRCDTFKLADLRIAAGHHEIIMKTRERNTRQTRTRTEVPAQAAPAEPAAAQLAEHA